MYVQEGEGAHARVYILANTLSPSKERKQASAHIGRFSTVGSCVGIGEGNVGRQ